MIFQIFRNYISVVIYVVGTEAVWKSDSAKISDSLGFHQILFDNEGSHYCLITLEVSGYLKTKITEVIDYESNLFIIPWNKIASSSVSKHLWTARMGTWQKCRINIFPTSDLSTLNLKDPSFVSQNPQFAVVFLSSEVNLKAQICSFLHSIQSIHVQSDFLVLTSSHILLHIHLLSTCDQNFENSLQLSSSSNSKIYMISKRIYKQFSLHKIHTILSAQMYPLHNFIPPNCNDLGVKFAGTERYCFVETLSVHLNFTWKSSEADFDDSIGAVMTHGSRKVYHLRASPVNSVQNLIGSRRKYPLGFMLVLRKPPRHFSTLFESLDMLTWIFLLVSSIITFGCLLMFIQVFGNCKDTGKGGAIVVGILAGLLEQPIIIQIAKPSLRNHWFLRIILSLWLCESIILMGGYRGVFFSLMTKGTEIIIPHNFEELERTHFPIIMVENLQTRANEKPVALIEYVIGHYLNRTKGDKCHDANTPRSLHRNDVYRKLLDKSVHLDALDYSYVKFAYDYNWPFELREEFPFVTKANSPNATYIIPDDFVLVSSKRVVEHFIDLFDMTGDHFVRTSQEWDSFIGYNMEFVITRNVLLKPLTNLFLQIFEAGIYDIWEKHSEKFQVNFEFKMLVCMEYFNRNNRSYIDNLQIGLNLTLCKEQALNKNMGEFIRYWKDEVMEEDSNQALTLTILWNIFYSGILGLVFATFCFLMFELFYPYLLRGMKQRKSTPVWEYLE